MKKIQKMEKQNFDFLYGATGLMNFLLEYLTYRPNHKQVLKKVETYLEKLTETVIKSVVDGKIT